MDRQQQAMVQIECQQLLNKVTMLIDQEQWEDLANCYTEDGILFRPSDAACGIEGRTAILDSFKARPPRTSCHVLANSVFNIISQNQVAAKSRVWLIAGEASETLPVKAGNKLMIGSFTDLLVYKNNQWLIKSRTGSIELKYSYE